MTRSVKGEHRKRQEDLVLAADGQDGLRTLSLRLPNFYGPDAELSISAMIAARHRRRTGRRYRDPPTAAGDPRRAPRAPPGRPAELNR